MTSVPFLTKYWREVSKCQEYNWGFQIFIMLIIIILFYLHKILYIVILFPWTWEKKRTRKLKGEIVPYILSVLLNISIDEVKGSSSMVKSITPLPFPSTFLANNIFIFFPIISCVCICMYIYRVFTVMICCGLFICRRILLTINFYH